MKVASAEALWKIRAQADELVPILVEAFGHLPPLDLAGGDAWVSAVARLVVPADGCWTDKLGGLAR